MDHYKTRKSTEQYAARLAALNGAPVFVFPVPGGTGAYAAGFRFGTYPETERKEYERDGAKPCSRVTPDGTITALDAKGKPRYERWFAGPSNADLRKALRGMVADWQSGMCDGMTVSEVLALAAERYALTGQGLAHLDACAADYAGVYGSQTSRDYAAAARAKLVGAS
jgi:hypothetical protein